MHKILYKKFDIDGWFHKHFYFKNNTEFCIFLVWALFVVSLLITIQ